jgi:hypothetical protein
LGAVILLFFIANARSASHRKDLTRDLQAVVDHFEKKVEKGKKDLVEARNTLERTDEEITAAKGLSRRIVETLEEKKRELALYQSETLASRQHANRLKADLRSVDEELRRLKGGSPSQDEMGSALRPFPGQGDRQYLTDLKMGGSRIFILVDASASMLDETIVGAIRRRNLPESVRRASPKWRHVVSSVDWLMTQIPPASRFQLFMFNEKAVPLIPGTEKEWLEGSDVRRLDQAVDLLKQVVPEKGTNLFRAFESVRGMEPLPDNLFLLTDGLPTLGAGRAWSNRVSGEKRLALFEEALRARPSRVPINIFLYPMEGDPSAAGAYWRLAVMTRGSFFCPSKDWP